MTENSGEKKEPSKELVKQDEDFFIMIKTAENAKPKEAK